MTVLFAGPSRNMYSKKFKRRTFVGFLKLYNSYMFKFIKHNRFLSRMDLAYLLLFLVIIVLIGHKCHTLAMSKQNL